MRILDRYILKSVFTIFLTCIFVFLFLYVIIDVLSRLEDILRHHIDISVLIKYYLLYLPKMFVQTAPFSCLISTIYTFGKLNRDNEIVAMRASGLSIYQVARTAIIFGAIISMLVFWVNDRFVPVSLVLTKKIQEQMESDAKRPKDKGPETINNLSVYGSENRLIFANKFFPRQNTMEGIIIMEHDRQANITKKIVANKGTYTEGVWVFYQSITYYLDENGQLTREPRFLPEEVMGISEKPSDFLNQRQSAESMTIDQINDYLNKLAHSGATTAIRNMKVDLYWKFTEPLTSLFIILLGIPFSFRIKKRAGGLASLGVSIIMGFLYHALSAVGIALGKGGILSPLLATSLSHVVALATSLGLIRSLP